MMLPISNRKRAVEAYCKYLGLELVSKGRGWAIENEEGSVKLTFDKLGRLSKLEITEE